jgi:hypothetical protein
LNHANYTFEYDYRMNMSKIELNVLSRQCFERSVPEAALVSEVTGCQTASNEEPAKIDWRFTAADARIKLRKLYPERKGSG